MITIARNRLRMNVLTHMMCYEHPTVHFSGALLTKIRFWSKKVSTRRDDFKYYHLDIEYWWNLLRFLIIQMG